MYYAKIRYNDRGSQRLVVIYGLSLGSQAKHRGPQWLQSLVRKATISYAATEILRFRAVTMLTSEIVICANIAH